MRWIAWRRWRVRRNLRLLPELEGLDRIAARHLFSLLTRLEDMAVVAAQLGHGVAGQLADEIVHRETFARAAEHYGGLAPATPEALALIEEVRTCRRLESHSILNVVAERWLEVVFRHLGDWGYWTPLWRSVGADEARHVQPPLASARGSWEVALRVRRMESILADLAASPAYLLPMARLGGTGGVARLGLDAIRQHRHACAELGMEPGDGIRDLELACRAGLLAAQSEPEPVRLGPWERSRFRLWGDAPATGGVTFDFRVDRRSPAILEARVVRAAGAGLARVPRAHRTVRGRGLWKPRTPVVGVRRFHDRGMRELVTVYVGAPHRQTDEQVAARIARRLARVREHPYQEIADLGELEALLPPARAAVVVTNPGVFAPEFEGLGFGHSPLIPMEGTACQVALGPANRGRMFMTLSCDHRAIDGKEMVELAHEMWLALRA